MKVLLWRIKHGSVTVDGKLIGKTGAGLCLFLRVAERNGERDATQLAEKATELRNFLSSGRRREVFRENFSRPTRSGPTGSQSWAKECEVSISRRPFLLCFMKR
jgi:hypothetical protein